jgi:rare lipoprotein A
MAAIFQRSRSVAFACACLALAVAMSGHRAAAQSLPKLKDHAQAIADEVTELERELEALRARQKVLAERIERKTKELGILELERRAAELVYIDARDTFIDRAIEVYKMGPTTRLSLLLSTESIGDLMSAAEITSTIARADSSSLDGLLASVKEARRAQRKVDRRKQELLEAKREAETVLADIRSTLGERRVALGELTVEIARLEEEARAQAALAAAGIPASQALADALGGPSAGIPDGYASTGVSFEGVASWYGPGFEGNTTANGEIFDPGLYTAASKELAFGTILYVEFQGRGVVVRINDRGPYVDDRILDLSQAAAQSIGLSGIGWIRATIVVKS